MNLRTAILTQGIETFETFLIMLAQWEDLVPLAKATYTPNFYNAQKSVHTTDITINNNKASR